MSHPQTVVDVVISGTTATVVDARVDGVTAVAGAPQVTHVSGQIPDLGVTTNYLANQGELLSLNRDVAHLRTATGELQDQKFDKIGGILSGDIIPNESGTLTAGTASFPFKSGFFNDLTVSSNSLNIGEVPITTKDGGIDFAGATGTTIFQDVTIRNLTVTGTEAIIDVDHLAVKDNKIIINSGEQGAGITLVTGGIVIDRGTLASADLFFNEDTDRFEFIFPLALDGNLVVTANQTGVYATADNLIATGQTLQTQITSNDSDISNLTANLVTTGATLTSEVGIVSGLITDNDGDIADLKTATGALNTLTNDNTTDQQQQQQHQR